MPTIPRCIAQFLRRKKPNCEVRLELVSFARGVAHIHEQSVVHGDLKGDNIVVESTGDKLVAKIADFGSSRFDCDGCKSLNTQAGTMLWDSPEVAAEESGRTAQSDMWAVGCVALEVQLNTFPYTAGGNGLKNPKDLRRATARQRRGDLPAKKADFNFEGKAISEAVWEIFHDCWRAPPKERPSAVELAERLEAIHSPIKDQVICEMVGRTSNDTSFVSDATGGSLLTPQGLEPCAARVRQSSLEVDGRRVVLYDMPGFDDTCLSNTKILEAISTFLATSYRSGFKLTGIIYMHRITDTRVDNTSRRTFNVFQKLCAKDSHSNILIVTNMWSDPPTSEQVARETELRTHPDFFQPTIKQGATMVRRTHRSKQSAHDIIRMLLNKTPVVIRVQKELVDQGQELSDTSAWQELEHDQAMAAERHKADIEEPQAELGEAKGDGNEFGQSELAMYQQGVRAAQERFLGELAALRKGYDDARWHRQAGQIRDELKAIEDCHRAVREQLEAALRQQEASESHLMDLQKRLADLGI
ncbi:tyrosine kinase catalytic domain protein [Rhizoctonia solani 123E]|uniref:non-specific serine/threonine protein kinase n=1 Tax=Rhizoctonia solani 123E TaxID=1423351 RepID=A0A074RJX5_9AGAM|nr:tyrosine kinase catalytic domain protein [Rhizoctonia solani 123E]